MESGRIIFLNGTSSAGKSTLAWELQAQIHAQTGEAYYWLSNDAFTDMPHNCFYNRDREGTFATAFTMLYKTALLFTQQGLNVIIDHVLLYDEPRGLKGLLSCVELLRDAHVTFVFVSCPLAELNLRELARGDRETGMAESQYMKLFPEDMYDIVVDTSMNATSECANQVIQKQKVLIASREETAFEKLRRVRSVFNVH